MKNAEYTFKQQTPNPKKNNNNDDDKTPIDPFKQRQLDKINKQQEDLDRKKERFKKVLARKIVAKFLSAEDNPNDDPQYLWGQVRPTLGKMGVANICQNNKTQLVIGESDKDMSLYRVPIRRQSEIDPDTINRIKRQSDSLKHIIWSNDGIIFYVWAPYISPVPETPNEEVPVP